MFTKENIKRLPEYRNVEISQVDFSVIDTMPDPMEFVDENNLVNQVFTLNPDTGFPFNDIDILESSNTSPELRDYLSRCLRSVPKLNNPDLSDDDLLKMTYSRFESSNDYVKRLESFFETDTPTK